MFRPLAICVIAAALFLTASVLPRQSRAEPAVVVSIKPINSLVAAVMEGVGEPYLLVRGGGSPHSFNLHPSDARALEGADLLIWVGRNLEQFLEGPLEALPHSATVVSLAASDGIGLLAYREHAEAHDAHNLGSQGSESAPEGHDHHNEDDYDPHLWLDLDNARAIVSLAATLLSQHDPSNESLYAINAQKTLVRLDALERSMEGRLAPVKDKGYLVFHDGFQYLQRAFDLNEVGVVILSPDRQPGARRVREVRELLKASGAGCIFVEPQFKPEIVSIIIEGLQVKVAEIDPLGADLEDGPELYFTLMERNAAALAKCLGGNQ
ncbi:zinc ABC transporter substrate-binding protein [Limibacillus sp. MBR-115]|jgi:zinc transport system substrate-binding protein|uniref:zinc ABC transporter substrate-binding protein n=1 Tax=Limibacillus sp. MBR-115 TaxID=3156465 RepID=UPI0033989F8C